MTTQKDFPFKVGDKIWSELYGLSNVVEILFIGEHSFFCKSELGSEGSYGKYNRWNHYNPTTQPEKNINLKIEAHKFIYSVAPNASITCEHCGADYKQLFKPDIQHKKKTIRMAPALTRSIGVNRYYITPMLYKDIEEAKAFAEEIEEVFIQWPANDSMWVDVPVEDE